MNDIDFDELDRAVSSVITPNASNDTPTAEPAATSGPVMPGILPMSDISPGWMRPLRKQTKPTDMGRNCAPLIAMACGSTR